MRTALPRTQGPILAPCMFPDCQPLEIPWILQRKGCTPPALSAPQYAICNGYKQTGKHTIYSKQCHMLRTRARSCGFSIGPRCSQTDLRNQNSYLPGAMGRGRWTRTLLTPPHSSKLPPRKRVDEYKSHRCGEEESPTLVWPFPLKMVIKSGLTSSSLPSFTQSPLKQFKCR